MKKRSWQEPLIRSIDACEPIFGACKTGTTADPNDPDLQCNQGNGASAAGNCTRGNGASDYCCVGNGATTNC